MNNKRGFVTAGLAMMLILMASWGNVPVAASHDFRQSTFYDLGLPLYSLGIGPEPECDEDTIFNAVKFCEAMEDDFNRVTIRIYDHGNPTPIPIGGKYTFQTSGGHVLSSGVFCKQANTWVPQAADELVVEVAHPESWFDEHHQFGVCGLAPFDGEVRLRWQHSTIIGPEFPVEDPHDKCTCVCVCIPPQECECSCQPKDGEECDHCDSLT